MTYETGTADDLEDLLTKLDVFADTTHGGWTGGYASNPQTTDGWFELSKGSLSFSAKYPIVETPEHMSLHQATGFVGTGTAPGAHTADSGNGYNGGTTGHTNANLDDERCVQDIGNGPFTSYHFFADDVAPRDYIHCVVQPEPGLFRHFGFGTLEKFGNNWVGGEYVYGHRQDSSTSANPTSTNHTTLLDGRCGSGLRLSAATMRIASGLENQSPAVWSVAAEVVSASLLNDTAGNVRRQLHGGYRAGMTARGFGQVIGQGSSGYVGFYPITAFHRDPNNARVQYLGHMSDVAAFNTRNFAAEEEIVIGSDTWVLFPMSSKTVANVVNRSLYSGIAYLKRS